MELISSCMLVLTVLGTKALEKVGETIGQKGLEQVGKLRQLLHRKSPETATKLKAVDETPALAEIDPDKYGTPALAAQLEKIANADPEIAELIIALAKTISPQPQSVAQNVIHANKVGTGYVGVVHGDLNNNF